MAEWSLAPPCRLGISHSQARLTVKVIAGDFEDVIRKSAAGTETVVEKTVTIGIWDAPDTAVGKQHIANLVVNHAEVAVILPRLVDPNSPPPIRAIVRGAIGKRRGAESRSI